MRSLAALFLLCASAVAQPTFSTLSFVYPSGTSAPLNTAMADYVDSDNAFIVASTDELTAWPHDPRAAYRTLRYMTDWDSLCSAYRASYDVAKTDAQRYARMSAHAVESLERFCSQASTEQRLLRFFEQRLQRAKALSVEASGA